MNLLALQHVVRSAQALAEGKKIIVLGSASLLASFPELGAPDGPLASTYDADILTDPFDELTAVMLNEALLHTLNVPVEAMPRLLSHFRSIFYPR